LLRDLQRGAGPSASVEDRFCFVFVHD
jgi:hypothetical protein